MESRRKFLGLLASYAAPALLVSSQDIGQRQSQPSTQKSPKREGGTGEDDDSSTKFDPKAALEGNKKDIKKDIEKLFQLASELKGEVEKTDSVLVLSLAMVKKAEEIEKLAKEIRSRAIG